MRTLTLLSRWLLDVTDEQPITMMDDVIVTKAQVSEKVALWQAILPLSPGQKWAVYHSDAIEFFALLLAFQEIIVRQRSNA